MESDERREPTRHARGAAVSNLISDHEQQIANFRNESDDCANMKQQNATVDMIQSTYRGLGQRHLPIGRQSIPETVSFISIFFFFSKIKFPL